MSEVIKVNEVKEMLITRDGSNYKAILTWSEPTFAVLFIKNGAQVGDFHYTEDERKLADGHAEGFLLGKRCWED